jgi:hypothetical protein
MAKNSKTVATKTVRDIKSAPERTQAYVKMLTRKAGVTAQTMRDNVGAYTCHNSWSLARLAETYGYTFEVSAEPDAKGYKRYFFSKPAKVATPKVAKASKVANDDAAPKKAAAAAIPTAKKVARKTDSTKG